MVNECGGEDVKPQGAGTGQCKLPPHLSAIVEQLMSRCLMKSADGLG
jgi:hypothetical protein